MFHFQLRHHISKMKTIYKNKKKMNSKSKKEIYAVNTDGTAHHQKNRGFIVPKNHAKELTKLGVTFKNGNLLENISVPNQENKTYFTFFIILDE